MFVGCTGDLDQYPLSSSTIPSSDVFENPEYRKGVLAKIYGGFALVGSSPGSSDIAVSDAGESEFTRAMWSIQTISTDEAKCVWGDGWAPEINNNQWTATKNSAIYATYVRAMSLVQNANDFLRNTTDSDPEVAMERAEVRFLRAFSYWVLLDCFGNPPFVDENSPVGGVKPVQISAADLFAWLSAELTQLTSSDSALKEMGTASYPRVDKGAAYGLLARLMLNHPRYIDTEVSAHYQTALTASKAVMDGYTLAPEYASLFMGDNGQNPDATGEMLFVSAYDATRTQSYGGTTFIIAASKNQSTNYGLANGWAGLVASNQFVESVIGTSAADAAQLGDKLVASADKRALFSLEYSESKEITNKFVDGWHVVKFNNNHFMQPGVEVSEVFASADFPLMRAAEFYLAYAEAQARIDGGSTSDATALDAYKAIRARAGLSTSVSTLSLDTIFDEITRELYWEGSRRTILLRFNRYISGDYLWPLKGGVDEGQALSQHLELFPLPADDLLTNSNLEQNPGY